MTLITMFRRVGDALTVAACWVAMLSLCSPASGQPVQGGVCLPVSQRTSEVGCWIIAHEPVGQLAAPITFWHLDAYPTRATAEAAKGPRGTVVESLGKVWLFTIENAGWRPPGGD